MGLVALLHVESSWTRDWTGVPCFGRLILHHWTTRTVLTDSLIFSSSWLKFSLCSSVLFLSSITFFITFTFNSSSDKLFISASLGFFQVFFLYSFLWNMFLCLRILFNFLCLYENRWKSPFWSGRYVLGCEWSHAVCMYLARFWWKSWIWSE